MAFLFTRVSLILVVSSLAAGALLKRECPVEWDLIGDFCYLMEVVLLLPQNAAEEHCQKQNSHLTSITSQDENNAILNVIKKKKHPLLYFYIGFDDVKLPGIYVWKDGYNGTFTNFETPSRSQDCIAIFSNSTEGKWRDVLCSTKLHFICKKPAVRRFDCLERHLICADGSCIKHSSLCDGISNCKNGTDEKFCRLEDKEENSVYLVIGLAVMSLVTIILLGIILYGWRLLRKVQELQKRENAMRPQETRATNAYGRPNEPAVTENKKPVQERKRTPYPRTIEEPKQKTDLKISKSAEHYFPFNRGREEEMKRREKKMHATEALGDEDVYHNFNITEKKLKPKHSHEEALYANNENQFAFNRKPKGRIKRKMSKQPSSPAAAEDEELYANVPSHAGSPYANDGAQPKKYRYYPDDQIYAND